MNLRGHIHFFGGYTTKSSGKHSCCSDSFYKMSRPFSKSHFSRLNEVINTRWFVCTIIVIISRRRWSVASCGTHTWHQHQRWTLTEFSTKWNSSVWPQSSPADGPLPSSRTLMSRPSLAQVSREPSGRETGSEPMQRVILYHYLMFLNKQILSLPKFKECHFWPFQSWTCHGSMFIRKL